MKASDRTNILAMIDKATDSCWDDDLRELHNVASDEHQLRVQLTQERIADALGAIVFLLLRQDDEVLGEWECY